MSIFEKRATFWTLAGILVVTSILDLLSTHHVATKYDTMELERNPVFVLLGGNTFTLIVTIRCVTVGLILGGMSYGMRRIPSLFPPHADGSLGVYAFINYLCLGKIKPRLRDQISITGLKRTGVLIGFMSGVVVSFFGLLASITNTFELIRGTHQLLALYIGGIAGGIILGFIMIRRDYLQSSESKPYSQQLDGGAS
ncbi:MAG: hypothetical protein HQ582_18355 [Planctomycetes bacterium]|nr:hypothetical protein [Planctomycetota bacterium]